MYHNHFITVRALTSIWVTLKELLRNTPHGVEILEEMGRSSLEYLGLDRESLISGAKSQVEIAPLLAARALRRPSLLAASPEEAVLLPLGTKSASLDQVTPKEARMNVLSILSIPKIGRPGLVTFRESSGKFTGWRDAVDVALTNIGPLRDNQSDRQGLAMDILREELLPITERSENSCRAPVSRPSLRSGLSRLTYSAVGLVGGFAAGGTLGPGLMRVAAGAGTQVGVEDLRGVSQKAQDRAVLDGTVAFYWPEGLRHYEIQRWKRQPFSYG